MLKALQDERGQYAAEETQLIGWDEERQQQVLRAASASRSLGIFESMWRDEASWREDRQGSTPGGGSEPIRPGICAHHPIGLHPWF